jgi:hypothetical protein
MVTKPKGGWDEGVVCCGRSNPQRSLFAIRFGDENATHGLRLVRLPSQVIRQFVQPLRDAVRLDVRERLAIDPRRATVGAAAVEGEVQDVATVHLVVKRVEAIAGRSLRFGMQRLLEFPNLFRRCEAHANLLVLVLCRTSVLNSGSFPPPALTGFLGVGSEEARRGAGLRPPHKLDVRFSRIQLSQKRVSNAGSKKESGRSSVRVPTRRTFDAPEAVSSLDSAIS